MKMKNPLRFPILAVAILLLALPTSPGWGAPPMPDVKPYIDAVRRFADTVLERGRDRYGKVATPLFVDGLHVETLEPARWIWKEGEVWVLSNLASQQPLFRSVRQRQVQN